MNKKTAKRRGFLKKASGLASGIFLLNGAATASNANASGKRITNETYKLDNPLIYFDDFHYGNRSEYSLRARLNAAKHIGYQGFEFSNRAQTEDESFQNELQMALEMGFGPVGIYRMPMGVVDQDAHLLDDSIEKLYDLAEKGQMV